MKKILQLSFLFLLTTFLFSATAFCSAPIEVKGYGQTKYMALKDALRMAIEMRVGSLVDSKTILEKNQVIKDTIYAKSEGYVKSYEIINTYKGNDTFCLTVRVIVDDSPNSALMTRLQSLKNIETNLNNPRIGLLLVRKHPYYNYYIYADAATVSVINDLSSKGFTRIVDLRLANINQRADVFYSLITNNPMEAVAIAKQHNVDYLIAGELKPNNIGNIMGSGLYSYRTAITWRIINTGNAQIIGTGSAITSGVDIAPDLAREKSFENTGSAISSKIVESLSTASMQITQSVLIRVRSMSNNSFEQLVQNLNNMPGVERSFVRFYQNGTGEIDINTSNSPYEISILLKKSGYTVLEISTNVVTVSY